MDEEQQGLESPILGGLRGIRRSISSNIFRGRGASQMQGDNISADIISRNSLALGNVSSQLATVSEQVSNINSSLLAIKDNLAISDDIEKNKQRQKDKRDAAIAEEGLRQGKESELEKKVQFALLTPVRRVSRFAQGLLSRLTNFLLILAGGWLTNASLTFLRLKSEGNIKGLNDFKRNLLRDLTIIGSIVLATSLALTKIFGTLAGLSVLLTKVAVGGLFTFSFLFLGNLIKNNVAKFLNFINNGLKQILGVNEGGVGSRQANLLDLIVPSTLIAGFTNQKIVDKFPNFGLGKNFKLGARLTNMLQGIGVGDLRGATQVKVPGWFRRFGKTLFTLLFAMQAFNESFAMSAAGYKPFQAIIVSLARIIARIGLFSAYSAAISVALGGIFAGVGGLIGGAIGLAGFGVGAIPGAIAGAAKGYAIGSSLGPPLALLSIFFPETTKKLLPFLDYDKIEANLDKAVTNQGSKVLGVNEETRKKFMDMKFGSEDNNEENNEEEGPALIGVKAGGVEDVDNITPFNTKAALNVADFAFDENLANVFDFSNTNKKKESNAPGFGGGVDDIPLMFSSNPNDFSMFTTANIFNIPVKN